MRETIYSTEAPFGVFPAWDELDAGLAGEAWEEEIQPETSTSSPTRPYPSVNVQLPQSGPGFYSYVRPGRHYGLAETVRALHAVGRSWQLAHPNGPRIGIGDTSFPGGGPMPPHKSHQRGVDVDIRPMRNDMRERGVRYQDPAYSRALTQELVNWIISNGILRVQYIFFNDPAVRSVRYQKGHDNHLHVRFYLPRISVSVPLAGSKFDAETGQASSNAGAALSASNRGTATGGTLDDLRILSSSTTRPTVDAALRVLKIISAYHNIPWQVAYVILEHEGGIGAFHHHDGVMQTTSGVRQQIIPRIPRLLKLSVLGLAVEDSTPDAALTNKLHQAFQGRLAVQIATGVQELKENLDRFNGYVALAYQAYNAGSGWAYYTVTSGRGKRRPRDLSNLDWENMCRFGASLLHQPPQAVNVEMGVWQCDKNIPTWFSHIPVRDRQSRLSLVAYKYLRSIKECIHSAPPARNFCNDANHAHRDPGSGPVRCRDTRPGTLDKLYDPNKLGRSYREAARGGLKPISDDGLPLKVQNSRLVKMQLMSSLYDVSIPI